MKLKGKKAIVTGGDRGIGKSITQELIDQGADVTFTYHRRLDLAKSFAHQLQEEGKNCHVLQLDVSSRSSIQDFKRQFSLIHTSADILVNNAGINKPTDFDQISDSDWDLILDTNLKSVFMMVQEVSSLMGEGGSVVNISSVSGQYGGPRTTHYCVSKAGLIALTQNMAIFLAKRGIRVNAIAAGLIESEMAAAANALGVDQGILLGRRGQPSEVASVASFLASDESSYITAQTLNVNGGLYF